MKKKFAIAISVLALVVGGTAVAFAQSPSGTSGAFDYSTIPGAKAASLEGTLSFIDGNPALVAGGKTYLLLIPNFYRLAYTGGIKEGAKLKLDGFTLPARVGELRPELIRYAVSKLNVNGADLALPAFGGRGMGRGMMGTDGYGPGMMGGRGGRMGGGW